jgi:recombination protein RecA
MASKKKKAEVTISGNMEDQVKQAIAHINQEFGAGTLNMLGDSKPVPIPRVDSGSFNLNEILGGGYPEGRIIEIIGPESSGKTTVALHAVAELQKKARLSGSGKKVLYIDAEHALDLNYAEALGVDTSNLLLAQPETGEEALQIAEFMVKTGILEGFVVDSVAALVPRAELEGDIGDAHVGLLARLMSQAMRKMAGVVSKAKVVAIFINQIREKVGIMFGNPETTPGGRALKFYASVRLDVRTIEVVKKGEFPFLKKTKITAIKNKVATPHQIAHVDVEFGKGISRSGEIVDIGVDLGLVAKGGNWYTINGERFNGRENAKVWLESNPDVMEHFITTMNAMLTPQFEEELPEQETGEMPEDLLLEDEEESVVGGE